MAYCFMISLVKTLLIMRHAKSSWDQPGLTDHDRPLAARGRRDAPRMAQLLADQNLVPDGILSSSSLRTQQTAQGLLDVWGEIEQVQYMRSLYHADPEDFLQALSGLADETSIAMTIAHNPGCEYFLDELTGAQERMPTAAIAHIELQLDSWARIDRDTEGSLMHLWRPKDL